MKIICGKCGKEMPIDKEKSNKNWKVYKQVCECGGKGEVDLSELDS